MRAGDTGRRDDLIQGVSRRLNIGLKNYTVGRMEGSVPPPSGELSIA